MATIYRGGWENYMRSGISLPRYMGNGISLPRLVHVHWVFLTSPHPIQMYPGIFPPTIIMGPEIIPPPMLMHRNLPPSLQMGQGISQTPWQSWENLSLDTLSTVLLFLMCTTGTHQNSPNFITLNRSLTLCH